MNSSGITRGMAATAIAALSVAGLPPLAGTAHAVLTTVQIVNVRDRDNFDLDEIRDGDDFRIETLDETGERAGGTTPEYRWVLDTAGGIVTGEWISAERQARGRFRVKGPSRTGGADGIRDRQVQSGTWTLEARAAGLPDADPLDVEASESEITIAGAPVSTRAGGRRAVTGTLANAGGGLGGREVELTYVRRRGGDAHFRGGGLTTRVITQPDGDLPSVTIVDPNGRTGESGRLVAVASGENAGDATQLPHRYGPNDAERPHADAQGGAAVTWQGPAGQRRIVATLRGASNGARADVVKVVAPTRAHGAQVRLFRVAPSGRLTALQVRHLNRRGDKAFRIKDRNRKGITKYVAKVNATPRSLRDMTNRRSVR